MSRIINHLTAFLVFCLAVGSFVLSYAALWDTALTYGVPGKLAWIWPLLIDFSLIVFSLAVVQSNLNNEPAIRRWLMVSLYTVATIAFNVYHAPDNLTARVVAVVAPVSLFLSFETLMAMLKNGVIRRGLADSRGHLVQEVDRLKGELREVQNELGQVSERAVKKAQEVAQLGVKTSELTAQIEQLMSQKTRLTSEVDEAKKSQPKKAQVSLSDDTRQERIVGLMKQGLTQAQIAKRLRVSLSTIKRDVKELNGRVAEPLEVQ